MNRAKRNKLLLAILAVALFIPTVVAIVNYNRAKTRPVNTNSIVTMTMSDLDGKTTVFDKDNPDTDQIVGIFLNMEKTAAKVPSLPVALGAKPFYLIQMSNGSIDYNYQYYFDTSGKETYYLDGDGNAYMVETEAASAFLATKYAASVYAGSNMPTLAISAEASDVRPSNAKWFFKDTTGDMVEVDCTARVVAEGAEYSVEGGMMTKFSIAPDYLHIEIVNSATGASIYNGDYEDGATFKFEGTPKADVTVNAKWYHDEERDYEGEVGYKFAIEIAEGASFYLATDKIDTGEVVAVTALNVKDPSKVEFSSEPELGVKPVFYQDGKYARALIPISLERPGDKTYKLTFKYGAAEQTLDLKVNYRDYERGTTNTYSVTEAVAALFTEQTKKTASDVLTPVLEAGESEMIFDGGAFSEVVAAGITRYFGRSYTIKPGDISYRQTGIEYAVGAGTNVTAPAKGKVVYVGELGVTGNVIVLEHGFGLKTLICHLGSVGVKVGDVVDKGRVIGTAGTTGFTNTPGVYVANFVGTTPISPYTMWSDGNWKTFPNP